MVVYVLAWRLSRSRHRLRAPGAAVALGMACVLGAVAALTVLATAGQDYLPAIMQGNHYTPRMIFVVGGIWLLSLAAIGVLWRRRPAKSTRRLARGFGRGDQRRRDPRATA